eukprot:TRINITY_DN1779_c0_g1_i5.p1 TRINITY_DN1779_c0_g1~~TRINITY_DN1779_c0_g1_i5.p1  ORF type:complete len:247 (+),score=63.65 TRINITY_DN1779_c0_g1_i5:230-970(+)
MNENEKNDGIEWFCNDFVKIQRDETEEERIEINPFCFAQVIIIVNNQIPFHFHRFWTKDGGANRLFDYWEEINQLELRDKFIPNVICGDFDSISPSTQSYYSSKGSEMKHITCQDTTDLEKCLKLVPEAQRILVVGSLGGNVSQELSNMNVLYSHSQEILLYGRENLIFLLSPHHSHFIHCKEGTKVGLIPLGNPCESVDSKGLKWDIGGRKLEFGGLVSTSNEISSSPILIKSSHPLLFSIDFRK